MWKNRIVGNWATFHITKLKCPKCSEGYIDLEQGKKNDVVLGLEKAFKQPIDILSKKVEKVTIKLVVGYIIII